MNKNQEGEWFENEAELLLDIEEIRISEQNEQIFQMTRNDF